MPYQREIDWETRERAEDLYVVEGLSFQVVSEMTGVSMQCLHGWSTKEGWRAKRTAYRADKLCIKATITKLRLKLASAALSSSDPQKVFAFVRLEALACSQEQKQQVLPVNLDRPAVFLEDIEFIAGVLKDRDPAGLQVIAANFDYLVEQFKAKHEKTS